ncbi:MAG: hypothetical protein ACT4QD_10345 [Acidobacteriota bacterium]
MNRRVVTSAVTALVLGTGFVTGGLLFRGSSFVKEIGPRVATVLPSLGGSEASGAIAPDGQSMAFVSTHEGGPDIWVRDLAGGDPVRLTNDAAAEYDLAFGPDGQTLYYTRQERDDTSVWRLSVLDRRARRVLSNAMAASPSPDGLSLAWFTLELDRDFILWTGNPDGSAPQARATRVFNDAGVTPAAWSPDSRRVAYTSGAEFGAHNLFLVEASTGRARQVTRFTRGLEGTRAQAWLPDNRQLAVTYLPSAQQMGDAVLGVVDVETGQVHSVRYDPGGDMSAPQISADGSRLLVTARRVEREVWTVPTGRDPFGAGFGATRILDASHDPAWVYAARDGGTLLFNNTLAGGRNLWTMPLDGATAPRQLTSVPGDAVTMGALSPDGTRVAFISNAAGSLDLWVQNTDGTGLRRLTSDDAADAWPAWSPDGRTIVVGSYRRRSWEMRLVPAGGGQARKLIDGLFRGDWIRHPDGAGTVIATAMAGGGLQVLDVDRRAVLWQDTRPMESTPMFSPDGRFVSVIHRERGDRDAVWVYDAATGASRAAVRFPRPFQLIDRVSWVRRGLLVVNRVAPTSRVVMFERFWTAPLLD